MNTAPFRTASSPPLRAFGSGGGRSFAERASSFLAKAEPTATSTAVTSTAATSTAVTSTAVTSTAVTSTAAGSLEKSSTDFSKAPKLSAAATAAYVPKNARPTTTTVVVPTPDMFPALPSRSAPAPKASGSGPTKPTFADIMKKRIAQDAIDAERAEIERQRERDRKEREERDNRYLHIAHRNSSASCEGEPEFEESGGYDASNYGSHDDYVGYDASRYGAHEEEEMSPPVEEPSDEWAD